VVEIINLGVLIHADSGDKFITVKNPRNIGTQLHLFFFNQMRQTFDGTQFKIQAKL